jgi:hypothetical protein
MDHCFLPSNIFCQQKAFVNNTSIHTIHTPSTEPASHRVSFLAVAHPIHRLFHLVLRLELVDLCVLAASSRHVRRISHASPLSLGRQSHGRRRETAEVGWRKCKRIRCVPRQSTTARPSRGCAWDPLRGLQPEALRNATKDTRPPK